MSFFFLNFILFLLFYARSFQNSVSCPFVSRYFKLYLLSFLQSLIIGFVTCELFVPLSFVEYELITSNDNNNELSTRQKTQKKKRQ